MVVVVVVEVEVVEVVGMGEQQTERRGSGTTQPLDDGTKTCTAGGA